MMVSSSTDWAVVRALATAAEAARARAILEYIVEVVRVLSE